MDRCNASYYFIGRCPFKRIFYNLQNRWRFFEIINSAINLNKINTFNMVLDFSKPTFWVVLFGGYFSSLATYACDQTMVQRYLTTEDENGAVKKFTDEYVVNYTCYTYILFCWYFTFRFF